MRIVEVKNWWQLRKFLNFPKTLYFEVLKDEKYVMPLKMISKITIGNLKNPNKKILLAFRGKKIVARLGVLKHHFKGKEILHWGFYECLPDENEATKALFDYAHQLYPHLEMIGPYCFQMEDPYMGLLIAGFEHNPSFMMSYNPEYYLEKLREAGLVKKVEIHTYDIDTTTQLSSQMISKADKCAESGIKLRTINPKKMKEEVRTIAKIFNDALKNNWGFEEMIETQIKNMFLMFKLFINPDVVFFAHKDGVDLGCLIMLPDFNPLIKKTRGRVSLSLIWNVLTKKRKQESCRGYALGILEKAHGQGIGNFLVKNGWEKCVGPEVGYKGGEISWILSDNGSMKHLTEKLGSKVNKIYCVMSRKALNLSSDSGE